MDDKREQAPKYIFAGGSIMWRYATATEMQYYKGWYINTQICLSSTLPQRLYDLTILTLSWIQHLSLLDKCNAEMEFTKCKICSSEW